MLPPEEDEDVPAFCRALGVPGLADIHTHFLPPRMLRRVWAYFDQAGPLVGVSWPIRYKRDDGERVAHLRSMGVRMFSALAYAHRPDMAADLNAWTMAFAEANPGCLPSATFYPEPGVARYVRQALDAGARIFKVHLQVGGFSPDDPLLDEVWGLLAEAGVPVVVHAGHAPVGTDHTGPEPFGSLLARYPALTAIVAHMGAPDYGEFLRLAADHERVALDTTMIFTDFFDKLAPFPAAALPLVRDLGLAGKILLGSDFPNIPYPYARQIGGLARLGLGEAWLRAVCWENPVALFGLPPSAEAAGARTGTRSPAEVGVPLVDQTPRSFRRCRSGREARRHRVTDPTAPRITPPLTLPLPPAPPAARDSMSVTLYPIEPVERHIHWFYGVSRQFGGDHYGGNVPVLGGCGVPLMGCPFFSERAGVSALGFGSCPPGRRWRPSGGEADGQDRAAGEDGQAGGDQRPAGPRR